MLTRIFSLVAESFPSLSSGYSRLWLFFFESILLIAKKLKSNSVFGVGAIRYDFHRLSVC